MKKQIISVLSALSGVVFGTAVTRKILSEETTKAKMMSDKHLALFLMMSQWVHVKQEGKSLSDFLLKKNYKTIAIYGMSYAGERLVEELKGSAVKLAYGIDRNAGGIYSDIEVFTPDEFLKEVDAVIVTSIFFMDEIEKDLSKKLSCPIISLEDVLYEI